MLIVEAASLMLQMPKPGSQAPGFSLGSTASFREGSSEEGRVQITWQYGIRNQHGTMQHLPSGESYATVMKIIHVLNTY